MQATQKFCKHLSEYFSHQQQVSKSFKLIQKLLRCHTSHFHVIFTHLSTPNLHKQQKQTNIILHVSSNKPYRHNKQRGFTRNSQVTQPKAEHKYTNDCIKFIQFKLTVGFIVNDAALRQMDRNLAGEAVSRQIRRMNGNKCSSY